MHGWFALSRWSRILVLAVVVGVIDYFAAGMSSIVAPEGFAGWFLKLFGVDAAIVLVFRFLLAVIAFLIGWRFSVLVGGVAFICVMIGVPFVDSFLGVILAGLVSSWFEFEEVGGRASRD